MSSHTLIRYCNVCSHKESQHVKHCQRCDNQPMLWFHCVTTGWKGSYTHWYERHRDSCDVCNDKTTTKDDDDGESKQPLTTHDLRDMKKGKTHLLFFAAVSCVIHFISTNLHVFMLVCDSTIVDATLGG